MKKLITLLLLCTFSSGLLHAQQVNSSTAGNIYSTVDKENSRQFAMDHIEKLRNGALLVVLRSGAKEIAALEQAGRHDEAAERKVSIIQENQQIINEFRTGFTFCPVYFVYADHLPAVRAGNYSQIFLHDTIGLSSDISRQTSQRVNLAKETPLYIANVRLIEYDDPSDGRSGEIAVRELNGEEIDSPFPGNIYYEGAKPMRRQKPESIVMRLDRKLMKFYQKTLQDR